MSSDFDPESPGVENVTDLLDVGFKAITPPALVRRPDSHYSQIN